MGKRANYQGIVPPINYLSVEDKERSIYSYIWYMLSRTQSMFKYSGYPETIVPRILELQLQINGHCCFARVNGELYTFTGGLGGEPDVYYMPTIYTVANPALAYSANLRIGEECIIMSSDSLYQGLIPMFSRYAQMLAENDLTMYVTDINSRIVTLLSADDDRTAKSAEKYIHDIRNGKLGVVSDTPFFEGLKATPYASSGAYRFTDLIEYHNYIKSSWFSDLGLQSNYNMKRENINVAEAAMDRDTLLPLIDDMLNCRKLALEKVNAMFGTSISVELASSWEDVQETADSEPDDSAQPGNELEVDENVQVE